MNWKDLQALNPFAHLDRGLPLPEADPIPTSQKQGAVESPVEDPPSPAPEPPPDLEWWWSIEHHGHPAFYLRTLMPGDFAPGRLPAPRHVRLLERGEGLPTEVRCGTCGEIPRSEDLEPVERQTGHRGFLADYRSGRALWPKQTVPESCWMCSGRAPATSQARLRGTDVMVCAACAKHLDRRT